MDEIQKIRQLVLEWRMLAESPKVAERTRALARAEVNKLEKRQKALYDKLDSER